MPMVRAKPATSWHAAFHNQPVSERAEDGLGRQARQMIDQVKDLADHDHDQD